MKKEKTADSTFSEQTEKDKVPDFEQTVIGKEKVAESPFEQTIIEKKKVSDFEKTVIEKEKIPESSISEQTVMIYMPTKQQTIKVKDKMEEAKNGTFNEETVINFLPQKQEPLTVLSEMP